MVEVKFNAFTMANRAYFVEKSDAASNESFGGGSLLYSSSTTSLKGSPFQSSSVFQAALSQVLTLLCPIVSLSTVHSSVYQVSMAVRTFVLTLRTFRSLLIRPQQIKNRSTLITCQITALPLSSGHQVSRLNNKSNFVHLRSMRQCCHDHKLFAPLPSLHPFLKGSINVNPKVTYNELP